MKTIHILSGGAAKGLVDQVRDRFAQTHGCAIEGSFGAVGAMRDKLQAGEPCDVLILTGELISGLAGSGLLVPRSARAVGEVSTGIAVKAGAARPDVSTAQALREVLEGANGVYIPDAVKSTAGIHFMKVLRMLGSTHAVSGHLRPFPHGAAAMAALAAADGEGHVGCTQVTEILYTPGVDLVGPLPKKFELNTMYTAAVCTRATEPALAAALIDLLTGDATRALREAAGFGPR